MCYNNPFVCHIKCERLHVTLCNVYLGQGQSFSRIYLFLNLLTSAQNLVLKHIINGCLISFVSFIRVFRTLELTCVCKQVEIRLACTATRLPPTPLNTGWKTAMPLNLATALSRMRPPALLIVIATRTGVHPVYKT